MILDSSDSEYPGPCSPSKINRSRIRPIPRLDSRKPSASESEDESRRYGRKRHNSVENTETLSPKHIIGLFFFAGLLGGINDMPGASNSNKFFQQPGAKGVANWRPEEDIQE